jgi:hypothetical protein
VIKDPTIRFASFTQDNISATKMSMQASGVPAGEHEFGDTFRLEISFCRLEPDTVIGEIGVPLQRRRRNLLSLTTRSPFQPPIVDPKTE